MNNLKYYEDSLAYDFSLFAPAEKSAPTERKNRDNIITIPETQQRRAKRRREAASRLSGKVSAIVVTVFIIAMLGGSIFLRSQITETEHKIAKVNQQISLADSKLAGVSFELEQKLSYANLESAAQALGMRKMEKSQIVYIRTNQDNKAVVGDQELSAENN